MAIDRRVEEASRVVAQIEQLVEVLRDRKEVRDPIQNEAANGLKNKAGTIAMARTGRMPRTAIARLLRAFDEARDRR